MNFIKLMLALLGFTFATLPLSAKVNNSKTITVKVLGNCEMCKQRIESAATVKKQATAKWDEKSHLATITFDSTATTQEEVLKRIAYAGHDNEEFLAPDETYSKLPSCCKYQRELLKPEKKSSDKDTKMEEMDMSASNSGSQIEKSKDTPDKKDMSDMNMPKGEVKVAPNNMDISKSYNDWLSSYLAIKNAFTTDNATNASAGASKFIELSTNMPMDKMSMDQHMAWMKAIDKLKSDALVISQTKDINKQRSAFQSLSKNVSAIVKAFKLNDKTVYEQFCPMFNNSKGAYWISEQSSIKNPYYGKAMSTCGNTTDVIKTKK